MTIPSASSRTLQSLTTIVFRGTLVAFLGLIWLWIYGYTYRTGKSGTVSRLQYFDSPPMVVVHVKDPEGVFLIQGITGRNYQEVSTWLDAANVDIKSIDIRADSIHDRTDEGTKDLDLIQFGVHGLARGKTVPNLSGNQRSICCGGLTELSARQFFVDHRGWLQSNGHGKGGHRYQCARQRGILHLLPPVAGTPPKEVSRPLEDQSLAKSASRRDFRPACAARPGSRQPRRRRPHGGHRSVRSTCAGRQRSRLCHPPPVRCGSSPLK